MAQLGRLEFVIQDSAGNAVSGASVEVRKQGAQVSGSHAGAQTTFNVDDPGAIVAGDQVSVNTGSTVRSVSSITATTVVVGGLGFNNLVDDDRLTDITLPTVYEDAIGNTSKTNPLTTDSTGYANCFVVGGKYDALISGSGVTTTLKQDMAAAGGESTRSNIYSGTAWKLDSLRSLAVGDIALDVSSAGTNKFKVMGDGEIVSGAAGATHNLTGTLTTSSTITATAGGIVATAGGITATAGNIQATAGDFDGRRLLMNNGTALVSGDFALSAEWGVGASVAVAANSYDTRGQFSVTAAGTPSANAVASMTFKDGVYAATVRTVACRTDAVAPTTGFWAVSSGTSGVSFLFVGLPVAGNVYVCEYIVVG